MDKKTGKGRALLTAAAVAAAALLAAALSYSLAKYVTVFSGVDAEIAYFGATSSITYTDAWGEAQSFDGYLGAMKPAEEDGSRTIEFTLYVTNGSDVPIYCTVALSGDYDFTFGEDETSYTLSEDKKTLTTGILPAGASGSLSFTVVVGEYTGEAGSAEVYSGTLDITVTYIQASEETTP